MELHKKNVMPVVVIIDVEPDLRLVDRASKAPWAGYEKAFEFFQAFREDAASVTLDKPRFSWFYRMDPQIAESYGSAAWAVENYSDLLEELLWHGDALGLHPHAWRWKPKVNQWIVDHGDQEWVNHCIISSFKAFKAVLGQDCEVFRFGDRWMNSETMRLLADLGVQCDLTLEPGYPAPKALVKDEINTGFFPDYTLASRDVYVPSNDDFLIPAAEQQGGLKVMPLTTGQLSYSFGRLERLYRSLTAPEMLKPFTATLKWDMRPVHFRTVLEQAVSNPHCRYLTIIVRSDAADKTVYAARMAENARTLLSYNGKHSLQFVTPLEALAECGFNDIQFFAASKAN